MKSAALAAVLLCPVLGLAQEYYLGQHAMRRGDLETAYREYKGAAENGDPLAARVLGMLLSHDTEIKGGQKLAARPEESVKWYRVGAEKGDAISADLLGARLAVGHGVARNSAEALRWFRAAGREVDRALDLVKAYPEADREEVAAWYLSLLAVMKHELKPLRHVGQEGKATLMIQAEGPRYTIEGNPPVAIATALDDYGRRLLEVAPPPPAAIRLHVKSAWEYVFK